MHCCCSVENYEGCWFVVKVLIITLLCLVLQQKHIDEVIDASSKFSKVTEEKLIQKMESSLKNREDQLKQLMDRLKDHVS